MARKRKPPSQRNPDAPLKAKMLDGSTLEFHADQLQLFRHGSWYPQSPEEPDTVPDAPACVITGANGRYFGWTHWGGTPGVTARSSCCKTKEEAYENLAEAIREVRKLLMSHPSPK